MECGDGRHREGLADASDVLLAFVPLHSHRLSHIRAWMDVRALSGGGRFPN